MGFIHGASNFKSSALKEHSTSECHRTGVEEAKHQEAIAAGISLTPKHVVQSVPEDSAIASGVQKMGEKERSGLKKLMDVAYFIALKGRPFTTSRTLLSSRSCTMSSSIPVRMKTRARAGISSKVLQVTYLILMYERN